MDKNQVEVTEELCRYCYEICVASGWNSKRLWSSLRKGMTIGKIKEYAKKYMFEYLNVSKEEFSKVFLFFTDVKTKSLFENYSNIINNMLNLNFVSQENLNNIEWVEKNLKTYIKKFCYEICCKYNWYKPEIDKYCEKYNIKYEDVRRFASEYINKDLNLNPEEKQKYNEEIKKQANEQFRKQNEYYKILDSILNVENEQELLKIVGSVSISYINYLKTRVFDYAIIYHKGSDEVIENLNNKLSLCSKRIQEKQKQQQEEEKEKKHKNYIEENLKDAQLVITEFINGDYSSKKDYCYKNKVDIDVFDDYIEIIKFADKSLYDMYSKKINLLNSNRFSILLTKCKNTIELIKNGIVENGIKREFNLLDYYEYTNLVFEDFLKIVNGKLTSEEYKIIKVFIAKNRNDRFLDIKNLYDSKTVIGVEYDKNGDVIEGSGREITREEKQSIVKYLNSKNIPITQKTYDIAFRRWLLGKIDLNEEKKKIAK